MNEVIEMHDDDGLMDIARRWYLRLEEYPENDEIQEKFDLWLNAEAVHHDAFYKTVEFWSAIDAMPEVEALRANGGTVPNHPEDTSPPPETGSETSIVPFAQKSRHHGTGLSRQKWQRWAVAASILIVSALSLNFYANYLPEGTYQTATGERQVIDLADGSTLFLNTHSRARVDYSDNVRRIYLQEGEARFDVAKDANRPFIVETPNGEVRAVGTSFNIYETGDRVEIIVFEGTVAVDHRKYRKTEITKNNHQVPDLSEKAIYVSNGERVAAFKNGLSIVREAGPYELSRKTAWQNGKMIFRGQKLSEVVKEMSRYTNRKIIVSDQALRDMEMGGAFDTDDFEALLNAIEDTFPVKIIRFTPFIAVIVEA